MTFQEMLEEDQEKLLAELGQARDAEAALPVLNRELERLQYRFHDACEDPRELGRASYMLSAVKTALPLVDTVGETNVWHTTPAKAKPAGKKKMWIFTGIGTLSGILSLVMAMHSAMDNPLPFSMWIAAALLAVGLICLLQAGRQIAGKPKETEEPSQKVEVKTDARKIYRCLHRTLALVDQNMKDAASEEAWEKKQAEAAVGTAKISSQELELLSGLLEAAYSGDGDFALERVSEVKYFLHQNQVEAVEYGPESAELFDLLPSTRRGTIRPALISEGKLLKKGLAAGGM